MTSSFRMTSIGRLFLKFKCWIRIRLVCAPRIYIFSTPSDIRHPFLFFFVFFAYIPQVFVFDFGSEMYIWMGKNVDLTSRKSSVKLAEELWRNGYNYEECDLCPVTSVRTIGYRTGI